MAVSLFIFLISSSLFLGQGQGQSDDPEQLPNSCTTQAGGDAMALLLCARTQANITAQALSSSSPVSTDPKMVYVGCATMILTSTLNHLQTALNYTVQGRIFDAGDEVCSAETTDSGDTCPFPPSAAREFEILKNILKSCCKILGGATDAAAKAPKLLINSFFLAAAAAAAILIN